MSIINHLDNSTIETCKYCHKEFKQTTVWQTPGFRDTEESVCPYCKRVIETSMEKEFHNEKIM